MPRFPEVYNDTAETIHIGGYDDKILYLSCKSGSGGRDRTYDKLINALRVPFESRLGCETPATFLGRVEIQDSQIA